MASKLPTPSDWPEDADKTLKEREKYLKSKDLLKLANSSQTEDIIEFASSFIVVQPILLQFQGITMNKKIKFGIIKSNVSLSMINYYAPKVGAIPQFSTFNLDEYMEHVYIKMTEKMTEKDRKNIKGHYDKYKNNPKEALLCVLMDQNGDELLIPLSQLITDKVLTKLKNNPPNKDVIFKRRDVMAKNSEKNNDDEKKQKTFENDTEDIKNNGDSKSKKKKDADFKKPSPLKKKQKMGDEDSKTSINIDSADPSLSNCLSEIVLSGFSQIFQYPNTPDNHAIMVKVVMETASILKEKGAKKD